MSRVLRVVYFFEDIAHERFVRSLTKRVARECGVEIEEDVRNATHGSKVWSEWRQFLREIRKGWVPQPDVLVVVVDGDCRGAAQVRRQLEEEAVRIEPRFSAWFVQFRILTSSAGIWRTPKRFLGWCQGLAHALSVTNVSAIGIKMRCAMRSVRRGWSRSWAARNTARRSRRC
jgi:hypothetical protein